MVLKALFPHLSSYRFCGVAISSEQLTFMLQPRTVCSKCPVCKKRSRIVHSRYVRTLAELPVCGLHLCLILYVRRFRCPHSRCERAIFCERLNNLAMPYARATNLRRESVQTIGLSNGGNEGARLTRSLRVTASASTVLRRVHSLGTDESPAVRVLGVDDWAFRKGSTYGTILCDLERGCVLDLLSERSAEALITWLSTHPEVEIISRDRGGIYAQGALAGAPQAQQVADRFHLLQNLTELMRRILDRHHALLKEASKDEPTVTPEPVAQAKHTQPQVDKALPQPTASQERRQALFDRIKELDAAGLSIRAISRELQIHRATVRRFMQADAAPPISFHKAPLCTTVLAEYTDTIDELIRDGETSTTSIFKKLAAAGYLSSAGPVNRYIRKYHPGLRSRKGGGQNRCVGGRVSHQSSLTPRSATWLLLKDEAILSEREGRLRTRLTERSPEIRMSMHLALRFGDIVRSRKPDQLDDWLNDAESSGINEFVNFAKGLRRDYDAVRAGLTLEWSNGPVEGHINRLKLVKRCMYGRGSLALLKKRFVKSAKTDHQK